MRCGRTAPPPSFSPDKNCRKPRKSWFSRADETIRRAAGGTIRGRAPFGVIRDDRGGLAKTEAGAMSEGLRIYNLFPSLTGTIRDWATHLPRIAAMGFNAVYINPFHYPGFSGSL